jgi:pimeloyl-ACP methyl ester carboxylesterase
VIDFIHERSSEVFGEGRMNIQKLILGGHSFGGLNAFTYGAKDPRVASILTLDPAF